MGWIISGQRQSLSKLELTKDEVVLRNLAIADLLLEGVVAIVDLGVQVGLRESLGDLGRVLFLYAPLATRQTSTKGPTHVRSSNRDNQHLPRRQPERPAISSASPSHPSTKQPQLTTSPQNAPSQSPQTAQYSPKSPDG